MSLARAGYKRNSKEDEIHKHVCIITFVQDTLLIQRFLQLAYLAIQWCRMTFWTKLYMYKQNSHLGRASSRVDFGKANRGFWGARSYRQYKINSLQFWSGGYKCGRWSQTWKGGGQSLGELIAFMRSYMCFNFVLISNIAYYCTWFRLTRTRLVKAWLLRGNIIICMTILCSEQWFALGLTRDKTCGLPS